MENIPVKLLQQVPAYSYFENNQLLTAEQLNNLIRHLDYQDRLTRARLIGAGIVCGLRIFFNKTAIIVTKGCGLTSDGDLISIDADTVYSNIIPLEDKDAAYPFFKGLNNGNNNTRLWEVLPENATDPDAVPLVNLFTNNDNATPGDFVVLLYLEQFLHDLDDCTTEDCDHKGIEQTSNLKLLLLSKNSYEKITKENECCGNAYYSLPDVSVQRVIFNPANSLVSYKDISNLYRNSILNAADQLMKILPQADKAAQPLFQCFAKNGNMPDNFRPNPGTVFTGNVTIRTLSITPAGTTATIFENKIKPFTANQNPVPGIQYVYDFLKDLAEAYYEFRDAIFELCQSCCLPADQFPKHLALGLLEGNDVTEPCHYRHCFIGSPILNNRDDELLNALMLYNRMVLMITSFNFEISAQDTLRITPSAAVSKSITEKAIPYYYRPGTIHQYWNSGKTQRLKADTNLSYHATKYSQKTFVTQPLSFDLDKYDFFRIEGHVGKRYDDVFTELDNMRLQQDLPFDIVGVQLQLDRKTIAPKRPPRFTGLDMLLETHRFSYADYLEKIKGYQDALVKKVPASSELKADEVTDHYGDVHNLRNGVVNSKQKMEGHITQTQQALAKPITDVGDDEFSNGYFAMMKEATPINTGAKLFTREALANPVENFPYQISPHILDWLKKLRDEKENKVRDGFVFMNFLKENPALLHYGGVPKGGTFVLLYENTDGKRTVVADFYLPYIIVEDPAEPKVDVPKIPSRPAIPYDDLVIKDFEKPPVRNKDFLKFKGDYLKDIGLIKGDIVKSRDDAFGEIAGVKSEVNEKVTDVDKKVEGIRNDVNEKFVQAVDNYQGSFEKIVSSYQTVLTKSVAVGGTIPTRVAEGLTENLKAFKVEDITEAEAKALKASMARQIKAIETKFQV